MVKTICFVLFCFLSRSPFQRQILQNPKSGSSNTHFFQNSLASFLFVFTCQIAHEENGPQNLRHQILEILGRLRSRLGLHGSLQERRPFSDDFRRAIAAKRRAEEESKFEHPKRHTMSPLRTEILRRSMSVSYGFHVQEGEAREDGSIRVYERTTSLVQDAQSDSSLTLSNLDIWNSLSSQSVATDFQGDKDMESESSSSPIQKDADPPATFDCQSSEEMPPKEGFLKPLKVKFNRCYKVVKRGDLETDVVPPSAADKKNCPNNLSPLRIRSLLTAEEKHQERRKRNNESAKKSRKNRRKREMDMMEQVMSLQEENRRLKLQLDKTQKELEICKKKERSSWSDSAP